MDSNITRGFLTIAVGKERYYQLARNLLRSYRTLSKDPMPFAVLCDRTNEYTDEFDKAIIMDNPKYSFMDKLNLNDYLPFDENIFIDADTLAYSDLNAWWSLFSDGTDFSGFGFMFPIDSGRGWFDPNNIGEYSGKVDYVPGLQGGVYFLRQSEKCREVFRLAQYFADHYFEYGFKGFTSAPADEPALALSMVVHKCKSFMNMPRAGFSHVCNMPRTNELRADITKPELFYLNRSDQQQYSGELIHWGNNRTRYSYYTFEAEHLNRLYTGKSTGLLYTFLYRYRLRLVVLRLLDIRFIPERIRNNKRHLLSAIKRRLNLCK